MVGEDGSNSQKGEQRKLKNGSRKRGRSKKTKRGRMQ